jgi:hypothetical protein
VVEDVPFFLVINGLRQTAMPRAGGIGSHGRATSLGHLTPEQYTERKETALGLTKKLTDDFYRATALRHIIALCMAAKDPDANILLAQVGIAFIWQKIVEAHPELTLCEMGSQS